MPSVCQVSTIVADWRGKKKPNGVSVLIGDGNLRMTWGFVGSWGARARNWAIRIRISLHTCRGTAA